LKRAAVLMFLPKAEKFVTGAFIKIGYFESDSDLIFQDEIHGNLFEQIEKTVELLFTKYIKAIIPKCPLEHNRLIIRIYHF
jgi:ATP-dependent DNA helicase RecG